MDNQAKPYIIISRKEAIERGERFYFPGTECKNGHIALRYIAGMCTVCAQELRNAKKDKKRQYDAEYCTNKIDVIREKKRDNYLKNRDHRLLMAKRQRDRENKNVVSRYMVGYRRNNKERINTQMKLRSRLPSKYSVYAKYLTVDDHITNNGNGDINAHCWYCGKEFTPELIAIRSRVQALKGQNNGEARMYCSAQCKKSCPTYDRKKYPAGFSQGTSREMQATFRKAVLARDNWTCQICGATNAPLHAHHISPHAVAFDSMTAGNGITLCRDCHKNAHRSGGDCSILRNGC